MRRRDILRTTVAASLSIAVRPARAAAPRLVDEHWLLSGTQPGDDMDHAPWDIWLGRYALLGDDGVVRLRYGNVSDADRRLLAAYVDGQAGLEITAFSRQDQLAAWLNLYNALTVELILGAYPVDSIRDIADGLFSFGPWDRDLVEVEGRALSLDAIEHSILRPIWRDPRIHYAVNCASIGCPNLGMTAYRGKTIEQALDAAARAYVNHPRGVSFNAAGRLVVSSIYVWFEEDFGGDDAGVIAHLGSHADPALKARLASATEIDGDRYDWSLNDATVS